MMRTSLRVRSARSAVLAVAVGSVLATGGLSYGSFDGDHGSSTTGAETGKAASPAPATAGGTANLQPNRGVESSKPVRQGSTADMLPGAVWDSADDAGPTRKVDRPDRGRKGARARSDGAKLSPQVTKG